MTSASRTAQAPREAARTARYAASGNEYPQRTTSRGSGPSPARDVEHAAYPPGESSARWRPAASYRRVIAYREGITVAERKGDKKAAKEMTVFARRIARKLEGTA